MNSVAVTQPADVHTGHRVGASLRVELYVAGRDPGKAAVVVPLSDTFHVPSQGRALVWRGVHQAEAAR